MAPPPPLPGFVTVTLQSPRVAPDAMVNVTVRLVLVIFVGDPAVTPEPLVREILTTLPATKLVPVRVSETVVPRSPLVAEMLVRVGAVAVVE